MSELLGKKVTIQLESVVLAYMLSEKNEKCIMVKIKNQKLWFNVDDVKEITHNE